MAASEACFLYAALSHPVYKGSGNTDRVLPCRPARDAIPRRRLFVCSTKSNRRLTFLSVRFRLAAWIRLRMALR
jgi:hypothetical protein